MSTPPGRLPPAPAAAVLPRAIVAARPDIAVPPGTAVGKQGPPQAIEVYQTALRLPGEISQAEIEAMRKRVDEDLLRVVSLTVKGGTLVVRDLLPQDVNPITGGNTQAILSNPGALTANVTAQDVFSKFSMNPSQACAIYGYVQLAAAPDITLLGLGYTPELFAIFPLSRLIAYSDVTIGYFEPVYWRPNDHVRVDLTAKAAVSANAEQFALLGRLCELPVLVHKP